MTTKNKILIVDDDINHQNTLIKYVEDMGYDFVCCENGEIGYFKAIKHFSELKLILMDFVMPKMNGLTSMLLMKQHSKTSSIPIIMMSSDQMDLKGCFFLRKPFHLDQLSLLINFINENTVFQ